MNEILI